MAVKRGLGKGLDTIIPDKGQNKPVSRKTKQETGKKNADTVLAISKVEPNRDQPRKNFDEESLKELAESIRQYGILQPLLVQEKDGYYEIIAGERRWRAAMMAGLKEVPVIIRKLSDLEIMEISLIENIQREDLNPIEEALAYRRLIEEFGMKQEEVAEKVSKNRTTIANSMRLLKLEDSLQQMVISGELSTGHARALLGLNDPAQQVAAAQQIISNKLSVRETEKLVKKLQADNKSERKNERRTLDPSLDAIYRNLEEQLKKTLGTKVTINSKNEKSGKVEIEYYSQDDLERILDLLRN